MNRTEQERSVDLTGDDWVLDNGGFMPSKARIRNLPHFTHRVKRLVTCRESSEFNRVMMDAMVQQTLAFMKPSPAREKAMALRLLPLTEPEGALPELPRIHLRVGKARAVLFEIEGDYFLYSMTSAAKTNGQGENDWTTLCAQTIEALRPLEVIVSSLSRLVRTFEHSGTMLSAVSKNVDVVQAGSASMVMRGPNAEMGQMMWALLAMVAASERNLIVQRLTAGVVAKFNRGEWIFGETACPLGYALDPITKNLKVDPESMRFLEMAWTLMANPNLTGWQILDALADKGVSTPRMRLRYGPSATVGQLKNPNSFLESLRGWSDLYLTGEYTTRWPSPFEGAVHIAGMPVHRTDDGLGELRFTYGWGRPEIDPALIRAGMSIFQARERPSLTGGAAHAFIPPLNGYRWIQGSTEFWLATGSNDNYYVRARGYDRGE